MGHSAQLGIPISGSRDETRSGTHELACANGLGFESSSIRCEPCIPRPTLVACSPHASVSRVLGVEKTQQSFVATLPVTRVRVRGSRVVSNLFQNLSLRRQRHGGAVCFD